MKTFRKSPFKWLDVVVLVPGLFVISLHARLQYLLV